VCFPGPGARGGTSLFSFSSSSLVVTGEFGLANQRASTSGTWTALHVPWVEVLIGSQPKSKEKELGSCFVVLIMKTGGYATQQF
jgi:hypothetical protein